jgi:hypothetical protein
MRALRLAAGLSALLLVSGCTSDSAPAPTPSSSAVAEPSNEPTPEPTIDATVTTAVVFGTRVEFRNGADEVIDSIGFDADSTAFVSKATKYFGNAIEEHDERGCSRFLYGDDNGLVVSHATGGGPVELYAGSSEITGVRIETPSGVSIGEDATVLIADIAPELKIDRGEGMVDYSHWGLVYDAVGVWGDNGDPEPPIRYGAGATVYEGALFNIMVPATVNTMHMSC